MQSPAPVCAAMLISHSTLIWQACCNDESPTFRGHESQRTITRQPSSSSSSSTLQTMCPRERWLNSAPLNHNWILLLPSCTSVPGRLMKFEWVLQQERTIIRVCLNDVCRSSPAVLRTAPPHQKMNIITVRPRGCTAAFVRSLLYWYLRLITNCILSGKLQRQ